MDRNKQTGLINITTLIFLGLIVTGLGFMYYKGYRLNVSTQTGVGPGGGGHPDGLYYTVQVSVTPNESNAIGLVNDLEGDGYDAYYDTYQGDMGRQYKVRVGQYGDQQSAKAVLTQVRQRYDKFKDSFISKVDD